MTEALKNTAGFLGSQSISELLDSDSVSEFLAETLTDEVQRLEKELVSLRAEVVELKVELEQLWKDEQMAEYELTSVFIHRGSSPSWGHYFFYARNLPDKPDEWFKYNDSTVSTAKKEEVLADTTGSTANPYLVSSAFFPMTH
jgi:ubiquitin carboxyl-terminal hydrolase 25